MTPEDLRTRRVIVVGTLVAAGLLFLLWFYQTLMVPIVLSIFVTYLLLPVVNFLDHRLPLGRATVTVVVLLLVVTIMALAVSGVVPAIKKQLIAIAATLPEARDSIVESWIPWLRDLIVNRFGVFDEDEYLNLMHEFRLSSRLSEPTVALQQIMNQTSGVLGGVVNIALVPVFSFFMIRDIELIRAVFARIIPGDIMPIMKQFRNEVDFTLRNVIRRQLTVALIVGIFYMIGFSIVGLRYSLAIGAIAGLCRVVPYLDVVVGGVLAAVVTLTEPGAFNWGVPIGVAIVFFIVQTIDGMIITPRVIGEKVGLHPAIVIASIFAFADWFGFAGVLLAIPLVAVIKIVLVAGVNAYRQSAFFSLPPY